MDVITMARELGKALQQEEAYIKWQEAQHTADADAELQKLIGEFNLKRMIINDEASKQDRDQEKLTKANKEMREVYSQIMSNENQRAKQGLHPVLSSGRFLRDVLRGREDRLARAGTHTDRQGLRTGGARADVRRAVPQL